MRTEINRSRLDPRPLGQQCVRAEAITSRWSPQAGTKSQPGSPIVHFRQPLFVDPTSSQPATPPHFARTIQPLLESQSPPEVEPANPSGVQLAVWRTLAVTLAVMLAWLLLTDAL